jgi:hypothetical protein
VSSGRALPAAPLTRVAAGVTLALLLGACSTPPGDQLVGEWSNPERGLSLRLDDDGTFEASAPGGPASGRYRMADDGRLEMEFDETSTRIDVEVVGEQLTFCAPGHPCERLRRAQ